MMVTAEMSICSFSTKQENIRILCDTTIDYLHQVPDT